MKSLEILSVAVLTAGLAMPVFAANEVASLSVQNQNGDRSPGRYGPSAVMIKAYKSQIRGTLVSTNPATHTITISEFNSNVNQTFSVPRREDLHNLKSGDKVTVTLQKHNPSAAQRVEKDRT